MPRYLCYLLVSELPGYTNKTYVGSTNNLGRRIRQHNGELKSGGAKYTSKYRPWRIVATVRNFTTEREALQFEWALQHPIRTRHLKEHRTAKLISGSPSLSNVVCCASFLVQSKHWLTRGLHLYIHTLPEQMHEKLYDTEQKNGLIVQQVLEVKTANQ
jgi:structure-specific endonuclease subunit SLX1